MKRLFLRQDMQVFFFKWGYFGMLLYAFLGNIEPLEPLFKKITIISVLIFFYLLLLKAKEFTFQRCLALILLLSIALAFAFSTKNLLFLKVLLLVSALPRNSFRKIIRFDLHSRIALLILMAVLLALDISSDSIFFMGGRVRHSLGFQNPNILGLHSLILLLDLLFLWGENISTPKIFIYALIAIATYLYSGCRTALILSIITGLLWTYYIKRGHKLPHRLLLILSPLLSCAIVFCGYVLFSQGSIIGQAVNELTSGRFSSIAFFAKNLHPNLLGHDLNTFTKSLDVAPAYMLYSFGIMGLFTYIASFTLLLNRAIRARRNEIVIITLAFILYSFSEKLWLFPDCNVFMLSFALLLDNKDYLYEKK